MAVEKLDWRRFFDSPLAVAAIVPADDVFGFLSRRIHLPQGVAALVTRKTGDHRVCRAGGDLDGDEAAEVLFVRTTPVDLSWVEERVDSADQFLATVQVEQRVSIAAERGELLSFRKQIMGSDRAANRGAIIRLLRPVVREALNREAQRRTMEVLTEGADAAALAAALTDAQAGVCFAAGLMLDGPPRVSFDSPVYRQVRASQEQAARQREEHSSRRGLEQALETAQRDHLAHLEAVLGKLRSLADQSPQTGLSDLIRTFGESERGEIYEALFASRAESRATQWIVVAAGTELLFYDPTTGQGPERTIALGGRIGPLRSVQWARDAEGKLHLLVGAARGVYDVSLDVQCEPTAFAIPQAAEVKGGVNSAALVGQHLLATHSEVGLLRWARRSPDDPVRLLENLTRNAQAVRNVCFCEGRIYCSVDQTVLAMNENPAPAGDAAAGPSIQGNVRVFAGSNSLITAVCPVADGLYAGNAEGEVLHWPAGEKETSPAPQRLHVGNGRAAESLHLLAAGGLSRLVFTDTSPAVYARVIGDTFTCRYEAGGQTLRRVEAAPDLLAATNELRDRLLLWSPSSPGSVRGTIPISRQTGHSVQDVCLLPIA